MLAKNSSSRGFVRSDTALPWTGPDGATGFGTTDRPANTRWLGTPLAEVFSAVQATPLS